MPTTALDGFDYLNAGPLTTTFTAPASCTGRMGLIPRDTIFETINAFRVDESCTGPAPGLSDCWPSGSVVDQDFSTRWPPAVYYHSPASLCPAGWTTVGSVVKNEDGHLATSWDFGTQSSRFVSYREAARTRTYSTTTSTTNAVMLFNHDPWIYWHARWAAALSPGETGIACCPRYETSQIWRAHRTDHGRSGFAPMLLQASCISFPPPTAWTATTICESIYTFDPPFSGDPISTATDTDEVFGFNITSEIWFYGTEAPGLAGSSTIRTLHSGTNSNNGEVAFYFDRDGWGSIEPPGVAKDFIPVDYSRVILLAHGGPTRDSGNSSDLSPATGGEESPAASETGEAENDENTGGDRRDGLASKIGLVLGTWALAMVFGAALIVPL